MPGDPHFSFDKSVDLGILYLMRKNVDVAGS